MAAYIFLMWEAEGQVLIDLFYVVAARGLKRMQGATTVELQAGFFVCPAQSQALDSMILDSMIDAFKSGYSMIL